MHPKKGLFLCKMCFPDQPVRYSLRTHRRIETPRYCDPYETRSWDDGCCVYKTGLASRWTLESHIDLLHIKPKTVGRPMGKSNIFMIMQILYFPLVIKGKHRISLINDSIVSYRFQFVHIWRAITVACHFIWKYFFIVNSKYEIFRW